MNQLNNPEAICIALHELCVNYQTHLENQLLKEMDHDFSIGSRFRDYKFGYEQLCGMELEPKPIKLVIYIHKDIEKNKLDRIEQIAKNYDIIEKLRYSLVDNSFYLPRESRQILIDFNKIFSKEEIKNNLKAHSDSYGMRFLKNVGYILSSFFFGAGLAISFRNKGSYAFWKSHGDITVNKMESLLEPVNNLINQNQITFP